MTIELPAPNRSARREAGRKEKNRKQSLAAISLLATTALMSSYVSAMRTAPSYSSVTCTNLTFGSGGGADEYSTITAMNERISNDAFQTLTEGACVTITFPAQIIALDGATLTIPEFFSSAEGNPSFLVPFTITGTGTSGSRTVLDGNDQARILSTVQPTTVSNLDFVEGYAVNSFGGAIEADNSLTVTDSLFSDNYAEYGGAIRHTSAGQLSVTSSSFVDNLAEEGGGAIYAQRTATVSSSTFTGNINSYEGGGGAIWADDDLTVTSSTFTANRQNGSGGEGGAIRADDDLLVTSSTFTGNYSQADGGAIDADDDARIYDSRFIENRSESDGGALDISERGSISNSVFRGNNASEDGGAVDGARYGITVFGSLFLENFTTGGESDSDGGALYMDRDAQILNNTFVRNRASGTTARGGAINIQRNTTVAFNTFVDNVATELGDSLRLREDTTGEGATRLIGNIFASSTGTAGHSSFAQTSALEIDFNLSTGDDFTAGSTNSTVTYASLGLAAEPALNSSTRETVAISSASVAADFVPATAISATLNQTYGSLITFGDPSVPRDQRGVARVGAFDAGSFEVGVATGGTPTPVILTGPALPPFSVATVQPDATAGSVIRVSGANLTRVVEVFVNGQRVRVLSSSRNSLTFEAPAGVSGALEIRFVGFEYEITVKDAFNLSSAPGQVVLSPSAEIVIPGFRANSTKLTRPMRKAIRKFVRANADLSTVTCRGFTSAPATPQDLRLARQRGKVTCDFIKRINSDLTVRVLSGSHTDTPGQQIRRVRLVMN